MTDLRKLIEAVEVGDPKIWIFYEALPLEIYDRGFQAYNGSLDAAKALHEALLPGWGWRKNHWDGDKPEYETIWVTMPGNWRTGYTHNYTDNNPARAWLLTILKAYHNTLENDDVRA